MRIPKGNNVSLGGIVGTDASLVFPKESRDKHLYVCGATGTGKSKFLESLIHQDIRGWFKSRCGMLLVDPHGSLYDFSHRVARQGRRHLASRHPDRPATGRLGHLIQRPAAKGDG